LIINKKTNDVTEELKVLHTNVIKQQEEKQLSVE